MSQGKLGPKFGPRSGPFPVRTATALKLTDTEVVMSVTNAIRRASRGNLKLVAIAGDCRADTAKNWMDGRNAPNLASFFRLAREMPELRAEAMRLMAPEAEFEPEFMRDLLAAMQTLRKLQGRK